MSGECVRKASVLKILDHFTNVYSRFIGQEDDQPEYAYARGLLLGVEVSIKSLPAEQSEIIRCRDCEFWEKPKDNCLQGRCELLEMYPGGGWYCANAKKRLGV